MITSSGEAEFYAQVSFAAEGTNLKRAGVRDGRASASRADVRRKRGTGGLRTAGRGRMKHLAVQGLWVQGAIKQGLLTMRSVGIRHNLADVQIKALDRKRLEELQTMSCIHAVPSHTLTGVINASA